MTSKKNNMTWILRILLLSALVICLWLYFKNPSLDQKVEWIKNDIRRRLPNASSAGLMIIDGIVDGLKSSPEKLNDLYEYLKNGKQPKDSSIQNIIDNLR